MKCEACGKNIPTQPSEVYVAGGQTQVIRLCREHQHELFLSGQRSFTQKYEIDLTRYKSDVRKFSF